MVLHGTDRIEELDQLCITSGRNLHSPFTWSIAWQSAGRTAFMSVKLQIACMACMVYD